MPLEEKFIVTRISTRNERHALRATWGRTRARKQKQEWGWEPLLCLVGNTRQGRGNSLGLSSLDGGGGFWAIRAGSISLVLSSGWLRPTTLFSWTVRAKQRRWLRVWALDWLVLIWKVWTLPYGPFAASDWSACTGQSYQLVRPSKISKHHKPFFNTWLIWLSSDVLATY